MKTKEKKKKTKNKGKNNNKGVLCSVPIFHNFYLFQCASIIMAISISCVRMQLAVSPNANLNDAQSATHTQTQAILNLHRMR